MGLYGLNRKPTLFLLNSKFTSSSSRHKIHFVTKVIWEHSEFLYTYHISVYSITCKVTKTHNTLLSSHKQPTCLHIIRTSSCNTNSTKDYNQTSSSSSSYVFVPSFRRSSFCSTNISSGEYNAPS